MGRVKSDKLIKNKWHTKFSPWNTSCWRRFNTPYIVVHLLVKMWPAFSRQISWNPSFLRSHKKPLTSSFYQISFSLFVCKQLKEEIRKTMELIVKQCVTSDEQKIRVLKSKAEPEDFDCYKKAVKAFSKNCYNLGKVIITVSYFCRLTLHAEKRTILVTARPKHFKSLLLNSCNLLYICPALSYTDLDIYFFLQNAAKERLHT